MQTYVTRSVALRNKVAAAKKAADEVMSEEAHRAEMADPYSYTNLFEGTLTPIDSPETPDFPLPSEFDLAFGLESHYTRPGGEENKARHNDCQVIPSPYGRGLLGRGSRWEAGPGGKLHKSEEWEVSHEVRMPVDPYLEYMKDLAMQKSTHEDMMEYARRPDDDTLMKEIQDGLAMEVDETPSDISPSSRKVAQLGPEGTILCDEEEEKQIFSQYRPVEAVYPKEWVQRRRDEKRKCRKKMIE